MRKIVTVVGRRDSTGLRFYLGDQIRQQELGSLTLGVDSYYRALVIPGRADKFIVDSYCGASVTSVSIVFSTQRFNTPICCSIFLSQELQSFLPFHTRICKVRSIRTEMIRRNFQCKGRSVWTKIIRNETAVDYLFNGEAYDFNYQFQNALLKPIQLYPVCRSFLLMLCFID